MQLQIVSHVNCNPTAKDREREGQVQIHPPLALPASLAENGLLFFVEEIPDKTIASGALLYRRALHDKWRDGNGVRKLQSNLGTWLLRVIRISALLLPIKFFGLI